MAEFKKVFTLVTEEIISKGVEFADFKDWLESRKPGGGQLENWTETDLRAEIGLFRSNHQQQQPESPGKNLGSPVSKGLDEPFDFEDNDMPNAGFGEGRDISRFDLTQIHDMETGDRNYVREIAPTKVSLKLERVETQKKGLFTSRKVYVVSASPFNWLVSRRRSDFEWLSLRLALEFPGNKEVLFFGVDKLQDYLDKLSELSDRLMRSTFFTYFFSCISSSEFYERKEREYESNWVSSLVKTVTDQDPNGILLQQQVTAGKSTSQQSLPTQIKNMGDLLEELGRQDESHSNKLHIFLEDLTARVPSVQDLWRRSISLLHELDEDLAEVSQKTASLAKLIASLSAISTSLELSFDSSLHNCSPNPSSLLSSIRADLLGEVLHFENVRAQMKKYLRENVAQSCLKDIELLSQDLAIRRESVQQLVYSARVHRGNGADNLANHRQEKVKAVNLKVWEEYTKMHQRLKAGLQKSVSVFSDFKKSVPLDSPQDLRSNPELRQRKDRHLELVQTQPFSVMPKQPTPKLPS